MCHPRCSRHRVRSMRASRDCPQLPVGQRTRPPEVAVGTLHIAEGGGVKPHSCLVACEVFRFCDFEGEGELLSNSGRLDWGGRAAHRGVVVVAGVSSHRRVVPSLLPLARVRPSGLNATLLTSHVCPERVRICAPESASHTQMV